MTGRRTISVIALIAAVVALMCAACNNPFQTREPETPDSTGGAAIKPATSPDNVLYNLRASFEGLSSLDYLDVFSDDFTFHPDTDDSLAYEQEFASTWNIERERTFAENFLQRSVTGEIEVYPVYEYKPGENLYDYRYSMKITPTDTTVAVVLPYDVNGHAWLYLREDTEGLWEIYRWVEIQNSAPGQYITWGVLRAENI